MSSTNAQIDSSDGDCRAFPVVAPERVRVRGGQLQGVEGTLIGRTADGRVLVQLQPGVQLELDADFVESC